MFKIPVKRAVLMMSVRKVISFLFVAVIVVNGDKTPLYIQGFVPRDNPTFVASSLEPAAHLAVEDVNNNTSLLINYKLNLEFVDTKVTDL